jgi:hypothetical protein
MADNDDNELETDGSNPRERVIKDRKNLALRRGKPLVILQQITLTWSPVNDPRNSFESWEFYLPKVVQYPSLHYSNVPERFKFRGYPSVGSIKGAIEEYVIRQLTGKIYFDDYPDNNNNNNNNTALQSVILVTANDLSLNNPVAFRNSLVISLYVSNRHGYDNNSEFLFRLTVKIRIPDASGIMRTIKLTKASLHHFHNTAASLDRGCPLDEIMPTILSSSNSSSSNNSEDSLAVDYDSGIFAD